MYACGDNHHGQLGLNRRAGSCDYPAAVSMEAGCAGHGRVSGIACGGNNSFALVAADRAVRAAVVGWGANELHQLPVGSGARQAGAGNAAAMYSAPTPLRMPDGTPLTVCIAMEPESEREQARGNENGDEGSAVRSAMSLGAGVDFAVFTHEA